MDFIIEAAVKAVKALYQTDLNAADVNLQPTRKEFEGQITIVTFPFTKISRKSPEQTGNEIGEFLKSEVKEIAGFNVIKGFLNISLSDAYWLDKFYTEILPDDFAAFKPNGKKVMVEYSSPNTNKPLHLGHVRNNLLGYSVAEILKADGYEVVKANLVNDRGIHICKSMLAWQKFGNGETPESTGEKGDHLVGKYYVIADKEIKKQLAPILYSIYNENDFGLFNGSQKLQLEVHLKNIVSFKNKQYRLLDTDTASKIEAFGLRATILMESVVDDNIGWKEILKCFDDDEYNSVKIEEKEKRKTELQKLLKPFIEIDDKIKEENEEIKGIAQSKTAFMIEAQTMLQQWEAGNEEVISLWKTMNLWVYDGFGKTYNALGVDFDQFYYESNTYLLGKDIVDEGLEKGVFFRKDDGSVWIDLTADGLDEKLVLRADGTSVYMTQDVGTAQLKYNDFHMDESIYVVGNEQDYHFKVLFLILQKLGKSWAKGLFHLSYGMVDLPSGKMKSREGTVVDADDLVSEMEQTAKEQTEALGKVTEYSEEEKLELYHTIGMGALKYFLLKVDPKKRLLFDPNESVDFQGHTGPFIQYTHARIRSVLSRAEFNGNKSTGIISLAVEERDLILALSQFPETITQAATAYSPAVVANYIYELAKAFNKFYHEKSILQAEDEATKQFRLQLSAASAKVIKKGMKLLGIEVPERM
ncbi:arginine--tRNA ligase [Mucilaginibacter sp. McL0603]|uniref:arginine--tRNA ligase n=1 Tax=Mucilaginibacter sp. McL0603 TaxID=3415670 RepID=UPI003CF03B91